MMNGCTVVLIFIFMERGVAVRKEFWSNVGTVLFSHRELEQRHWPKQRIALLQARRYVQELIPPPDYLVSDQQYIQTTLQYFRNGYATIKEVCPDHEINKIMTTALSDAVGGYLKIYVLPLTKLDYYAGTVSFEDSTKLLNFYSEVKNYLNTNGSGWRDSSNEQISNMARIAPRMRRKQAVNECPSSNPCNCFAYLQKTDNGYTVPLPSINWEDGTMFIPFKNQTTFSLESPKYYNSLNNYYLYAKCCLRTMGAKCEREFDQKFQYWLLKDVIPRLSDDHLYVALGNVLSMVNQSDPFFDSKISINTCKPSPTPIQYVPTHRPHKQKFVTIEHKPCGLVIIDRLIHSKRLVIIAIIIISEIVWCILVFKHIFYRKGRECKDQSSYMDRMEKGQGSGSISRTGSDKCLSRKCSKTRHGHNDKHAVNDVTVTRVTKGGSVGDIKGGGLKLYKNPHSSSKVIHLGTQYSSQITRHTQGINTINSGPKQKKVEINLDDIDCYEGKSGYRESATWITQQCIDKTVQSASSGSELGVTLQRKPNPAKSVKHADLNDNVKPVSEPCPPALPSEPCTCGEKILNISNMNNTNDVSIITDIVPYTSTTCSTNNNNDKEDTHVTVKDNVREQECTIGKCAVIEDAKQPRVSENKPYKLNETLALLRHSEKSMKKTVICSRDIKQQRKQGFHFEVLSASFPPSAVRMSEMCTCAYNSDNTCPCVSCLNEPEVDNVLTRQESLSCKTCLYDTTEIITEKKTSGSTTETKTLVMQFDGGSATTLQGIQQKQTIHLQKEIYVTEKNNDPPKRMRKPYVEIQIQKPRNAEIKLGISGIKTKVETSRRSLLSKIPTKAQTLEYSHVSQSKHYNSPREESPRKIPDEECVRICDSPTDRTTETTTTDSNRTETTPKEPKKKRSCSAKLIDLNVRSEPCSSMPLQVSSPTVKDKLHGILKYRKKRAKIEESPPRYSSTQVYVIESPRYFPQAMTAPKETELPTQELPKQAEISIPAEPPKSPKPRSPEGHKRSFIPKLKKPIAADDTEIRSRRSVTVTDSKLNITL